MKSSVNCILHLWKRCLLKSGMKYSMKFAALLIHFDKYFLKTKPFQWAVKRYEIYQSQSHIKTFCQERKNKNAKSGFFGQFASHGLDIHYPICKGWHLDWKSLSLSVHEREIQMLTAAQIMKLHKSGIHRTMW